MGQGLMQTRICGICKKRPADADGGKSCAVCATPDMFVGAPEKLAPTPAAQRENPAPNLLALAKGNRGAGSKREPLKVNDESSKLRLIEVAKNYGEVWCFNDEADSKRILNQLFEDGIINPITRIARQPRHVSRFMLTPKGRAL